jgi:hypothetical protein
MRGRSTGSGAPPRETMLLERLTPKQVADLGRLVGAAGIGAASRQIAAQHVIDILYGTLLHRDGAPALVLARCFETCAYARLPLDYRDAADKLLEQSPAPSDMRCLALMGTRGLKGLWDSPTTSFGHQAIPLPSAEVVRRAPMIAALLEQVGVPIEAFVAREFGPEILFPSEGFNVFYVDEAAGSPFLPAQSGFVEPYGVRSVVGFGGQLGPGDFFAVILFARVAISREVAMLFRALAPAVRQAMEPFPPERLFGEH